MKRTDDYDYTYFIYCDGETTYNPSYQSAKKQVRELREQGHDVTWGIFIEDRRRCSVYDDTECSMTVYN